MPFEVLQIISNNNLKQPIQCYVYSLDAVIVTDWDKDLPGLKFVLTEEYPRVQFSLENQ